MFFLPPAPHGDRVAEIEGETTAGTARVALAAQLSAGSTAGSWTRESAQRVTSRDPN